MAFKLRLRAKRFSRERQDTNEENFLVEASKVPVSVDFRCAGLNATKCLIKFEKRTEKSNIMQKNIANLKLFSENMKNSKPTKNLSKSIENIILPSILPQFQIKNNHTDRKKSKKMKNLSIHMHEKSEISKLLSKRLSIREENSPKQVDLYNFLKKTQKVLVKNEETVGNLVKYSTVYQKHKGKFQKFYMD